MSRIHYDCFIAYRTESTEHADKPGHVFDVDWKTHERRDSNKTWINIVPVSTRLVLQSSIFSLRKTVRYCCLHPWRCLDGSFDFSLSIPYHMKRTIFVFPPSASSFRVHNSFSSFVPFPWIMWYLRNCKRHPQRLKHCPYLHAHDLAFYFATIAPTTTKM